MNHKLEQKITVGSVARFTLPSIAMMLVMSMYTVVDGTFVSRLMNTDAFSAVNIVYPLLSVVIALGTMFGAGLTAIVSIKLGEGKKREANENLSFVICFTILLGIVLSLAAFIFLEDIIYFLGADENIYGYCYAYAMPLLFFFPANILQLQFQMLFVANGKPGIGLIVTILGGVTNVVLDYVFIAICGWGISGAAIATGIGYCIPAVTGLCYFYFRKNAPLHFVKPRADFRMLLHTVTNGSSEMVSNLSTSVTTLLFNIILMRLLGSDGVAAVSILLYLDFVLIAVSLGYSLGVAPLISYNYGCGNRDKLSRLFRYSAYFAGGSGLIMTVGTLLLTGPLTSIFTPEGSSVQLLAEAGLRIYAFSYLFKCYNVFASAMFTAYSNGKVSAILAFARTLVFLTGALLCLSALFGVDGVWLASPLAEALAFVMSICYTFAYRKRYWQKQRD